MAPENVGDGMIPIEEIAPKLWSKILSDLWSPEQAWEKFSRCCASFRLPDPLRQLPSSP